VRELSVVWERKKAMERENRPCRTACIIAAVVISFNAVLREGEGKTQTTKYIDYVAELNKLGVAGRPESDNAAPFYQKAAELYVKFSQQQAYPTMKGWPVNLPENELSEIRNWVQVNSQALLQLELGSKKPYCWFQLSSPDGIVFGILIPDLAEYKALCYAITERAKLAAAEGNIDKAIADIVTCYRCGLHLMGPGPKDLIAQLVGIAVRARSLQSTFDILNRTKVDKNSLSSMQMQIEGISTSESYTPDFRFDRFALLDQIQRVFNEDGKGDGQIDLESAKRMFLVPGWNDKDIASLKELGRRQTTETGEKLYKYFDFIAQKSPWQWKAENINHAQGVEKIIHDNYIVAVLTPAGVRVAELFARCRADTDGLITTLALLRYKAEKGQFPEKLDELVPAGYLKALASDPFSGKPFAYKRVGEDFMLYSFGPDCDDDGGTRGKRKWSDEGGDAVLWPVLRSEGTIADTVSSGDKSAISVESTQPSGEKETVQKPVQRQPRDMPQPRTTRRRR
jgi:hypothetical protein